MPAPPAPVETKTIGKTGSWPDCVQPEVIKTEGKLFRGAGTVPAGLSVAVVPPLKIIADVRLVTKATLGNPPSVDFCETRTHSIPDFEPNVKTGIDDFKTYYETQLTRFEAVIKTSVVMELQPDSKNGCSEANHDGARQAAVQFTRRMKLHGKHVSIMLTVPQLPSVGTHESATVKDIDTGTCVGMNRNNAVNCESSEESYV